MLQIRHREILVEISIKPKMKTKFKVNIHFKIALNLSKARIELENMNCVHFPISYSTVNQKLSFHSISSIYKLNVFCNK